MRGLALAAVSLMLVLAVPAAAQRDWSQVEITSEKVADGIYMLKGAGGNIGVSVGDDGVFLVDDQLAPLTDKIVEAIRRLSGQRVRFVFNTHWHGDHTGGNEKLGAAGALIVAQDNVRTRMSVKQFSELMGDRDAAPEGALPIVTFSEAVTFHLNGGEVHAFHVPHAHTDGDAIVHFRDANVIHAGDTVFGLMYPLIDADRGGSVDGMIAACDRMLELADDETKIIPGHGDLTDRAGLEAYRGMLVTVRNRVEKQMEHGKSLDEIVAAKVTKDLDAQWQKFVEADRFVKMVYVGLAKN